MNSFLETPIEFLKGVGPQRAELLRKELGIANYENLLNHFPFRYVDRSAYQKVKDAPYSDFPLQLKGKIISLKASGIGRKKRLNGVFEDESGRIELVWFQGADWVQKNLSAGRIYQVYGKAKKYGSSYNIAHPEVIPWEQVDRSKGMQGVYSSTEKLTDKGLHTKGLSRIAETLVEQLSGKVAETLPLALRQRFNLMDLEEAYVQIHRPETEEKAQRAIFRLKFEELFFLQMELLH